MAATSEQRHRSRLPLLAAILILVSLGAPVLAQVVVVPSVPGSSNPFLAGMPNGTLCCSGDSAPAQSPVQVTGLPVTPGWRLTFSVTGSVDNTGAPPTLPPDGSGLFSTVSNDGIAGATWPINALVGVFLDNNLPTATVAPAALDFSGGGIGTAFTTLSPGLKQAFFIGDGLTGNGTGTVQKFVVPTGATRFYLGTSDGVGWFNNSGAFAVTVTATAPSPVSAPVASQIPTLSEWALALLAIALVVGAAYAIRRRA